MPLGVSRGFEHVVLVAARCGSTGYHQRHRLDEPVTLSEPAEAGSGDKAVSILAWAA
jgi:hypothetical protein